MARVSPSDAAARVRAAISYAGLEYEDVEAQTGIGRATLARITARGRPRGASIEELWAIADACGVPRPFMESGWASTIIDSSASAAPSVMERLSALEVQVRELGARHEKVGTAGRRRGR